MRLNPIDALLFVFLKLAKALDPRKTGQQYFDPIVIKNILVVSSTAIGDTLLSTPAIRAVRERYPDARIIAHFNADNMELFENNPHIDGIVPYYGGYKRFFKTIARFRKHKFDLALIFHGNEPQATPAAYLSGAPFIFKLPNVSKYGFLLSNNRQTLGWQAFKHGTDQRSAVAELADCKIKDKRMVLPISDSSAAAAQRFLQDNGVSEKDIVIGFQVGASTLSRMWFKDRFIELGKRLVDAAPNLRIVLTGSPRESSYCAEIAQAIGDRAIVSSGQMALRHLPALISGFRALVTGDTGTMHVAVAVGTPVVALFAVADAEKSGPYYDLARHTVIQKQKICDPCASKRCEYQRCMEAITVDEVFEAVKPLLRL
ncbi:MAG: glycosyltransferase family 9 protein [Nitrospirae bacterium]|nr:MAG: glycosyltransferase family 9 protein [Nitrospirota bacterium]